SDRARRRRPCDLPRRKRGASSRRLILQRSGGRRSLAVLSFGVERLGDEFAVGFSEQDFYAPFGVFELLLALPREDDAFFEQFHGVVEGKLRTFQAADDFFETGERFFEVRLLRRLGLLDGIGIHAISLSPIVFVSESAAHERRPTVRRCS